MNSTLDMYYYPKSGRTETEAIKKLIHNPFFARPRDLLDKSQEEVSENKTVETIYKMPLSYLNIQQTVLQYLVVFWQCFI